MGLKVVTKKRNPKNTSEIRSVRSQTLRGKKFTTFIKPMLATITDKAFDDPDWIFEMKWDGYRAVAELAGNTIKLYSRNGLSFLPMYPALADRLKALKIHAVLDGEIVVLDEAGRPNFQKLQNFRDDSANQIVYYAFDCLAHRGNDITDLPLLERKTILRDLIPHQDTVLYSDHVVGNGLKFFRKAVSLNMEGVMAKHSHSLYEKGKRTKNWLKVKNHNSTEAIIAGYTAPRSSRQYFGSLVLGRYHNNRLKYLGHTGTGFSVETLKELYRKFQPLVRTKSPFSEKIPVKLGVTWLDPKLVCNVKFSELTSDAILRHPVFMGLRVDKSAKEIDRIESKIKRR